MIIDLKSEKTIWPLVALVLAIMIFVVRSPRQWRSQRPKDIFESLPPISDAQDDAFIVAQPNSKMSPPKTPKKDAKERPLVKLASTKQTRKHQPQFHLAKESKLVRRNTSGGRRPPVLPVPEPARSKADAEIAPVKDSPRSTPSLSEQEPNIELSPIELEQVESALPEEIQSVPSVEKAEPHWPIANCVIEKLKELQTNQLDEYLQLWTNQSVDTLQSLGEVEIQSVESRRLLKELLRLANAPEAREPNIADQLLASDIRRAAYALRRRAEVWITSYPVYEVAAIGQPREVNVVRVLPVLVAIEKMMEKCENKSSWFDFLQLQSLRELATHPVGVDATIRRQLARDVLQRMNAVSLSDSQAALLAKPPFMELKRQLVHWAFEPVDVGNLLKSIEEFESSRQEPASVHLVHQIQNLKWCEHEKTNTLAKTMEMHYRNANFRFAISSELLNDLLPVLRPIEEPVKDQLLGAEVTGKNNTWTKLGLRLVPDPNRIRFQLFADGRTESRTISSKGPVRVHSLGNSRFAAGKDVFIGRRGLLAYNARAKAQGRTRLLDVETDYDRIPLLGWIIRQMAIDEHHENRFRVKSHVQQRVSSSAKQRLNNAIGPRLDSAEQKVAEKVIAPLRKLNLDLRAMEMRSTEKNLVVRCRLAGSHQLASFTARPRALSNCLLSTQMHESAINNLLQQIDLDGRKVELEELMNHLRTQLGIERKDIHEDIPEGVTIRLAQGRPISVEFDGDRIQVTIALAELKTKRRRWRNFVVRAKYRANLGRAHVDLQRDGGVELISKKLGFRDQIALRGIFAKVMTKDHRLQIIRGRFDENEKLKNIQVTQFLARDGWIGISLGVRSGNTLAELPELLRSLDSRHMRR